MGSVITLFANRKFNISLKVAASVQNLLNSTGQYTDSWPCTALLKVISCVSVSFINGQLVLDSGNIHAIIRK